MDGVNLSSLRSDGLCTVLNGLFSLSIKHVLEAEVCLIPRADDIVESIDEGGLGTVVANVLGNGAVDSLDSRSDDGLCSGVKVGLGTSTENNVRPGYEVGLDSGAEYGVNPGLEIGGPSLDEQLVSSSSA